MNDDGLAYGSVASSRIPRLRDRHQGYELAPYGIMQPKDDPAFKKVVDGAVLDMIKNGKVAALYEKYFNSPIPPKQINLKYPMSDAFKRALANRPIRATPRPTSKRLRRARGRPRGGNGSGAARRRNEADS